LNTRRPPEPRQAAEIVAVQALTFIAEDGTRFGRFLAETGLGPETLRSAAKDPAFLVGVLDFLLRDETMLKAFSEASHLDVRIVGNARETLEPTWESDVP
jgi:hypothetical protein